MGCGCLGLIGCVIGIVGAIGMISIHIRNGNYREAVINGGIVILVSLAIFGLGYWLEEEK